MNSQKIFNFLHTVVDRRYMGCFKDTDSRAMSVSLEFTDNIDECIELCGQRGHEYAGLQVRKNFNYIEVNSKLRPSLFYVLE